MKHQWLFERSQYQAYQTWLTMINKEITEYDLKKCALCQSDANQYPLTLQPFPKDYDFSASDHNQGFVCTTCLDSIFACHPSKKEKLNGCFIYLPEVNQLKLNYFMNWLQYGNDISSIDKKSFYAELKACQGRWLDIIGIDISDPFYFRLFYHKHLDQANKLFDKTRFLPHFTDH
ncbi:hypothetical protein [Cysteiniphilum sp. 6C5]|uniref:hypothetical protein n=1 Tax=unclassified Cysteiniphilum TaxID=2610889 RepID=UPI003F879B19